MVKRCIPTVGQQSGRAQLAMWSAESLLSVFCVCRSLPMSCLLYTGILGACLPYQRESSLQEENFHQLHDYSGELEHLGTWDWVMGLITPHHLVPAHSTCCSEAREAGYTPLVVLTTLSDEYCTCLPLPASSLSETFPDHPESVTSGHRDCLLLHGYTYFYYHDYYLSIFMYHFSTRNR